MSQVKNRICYKSKAVQRAFEDISLLEKERRILKKVLNSLPPGFSGTFVYPGDGAKIDGKIYVFHIEVGQGCATLNAIEMAGRGVKIRLYIKKMMSFILRIFIGLWHG